MVIAESLMASCQPRQVGWKQGRSLSEPKQLSFAIETNAVIDVDGNVTSLGMLMDGPPLEHKTALL